MKNLQNLKGAKTLSKKEQQSINGGGPCNKGFFLPPECSSDSDCSNQGEHCDVCQGICV